MKQKKNLIAFLGLIIILQSFLIIYLLAARPKKPVSISLPPIKVKGKIAIVIDDWGYRKDTLDIASRIKYPMTMSVLPNLDFSVLASQKLHDMGFEIILHLPMEPYEKYRLEKNTILCSMEDAQIKNILNDDLAGIKFCKGLSNHMGSKLTSDTRVMKVIFSELKKKKLYFFDSYVSSDSVARGLAEKMGIKSARRDVFLDNESSPRYIRIQINKLKNKARIHGHAIGVGHDRKSTLEVLAEVMPELSKEGYKFVYLSELVE
ncbi:MAG: divergent polysaccharide deacetylase family protein [Candidatus Omnitrophica bacterium]|nr:divergent polysaccharide deacetylase family protein [Candidatus Omnitrophota bacterium]